MGAIPNLITPSNPILDEIRAAHANLSEPAQAALAKSGITTPAPAPAAPVMPAPMTPASSLPPAVAPAPSPVPTPEQEHRANLQRLTAAPVPGLEHTTASTGQSGVDQIHNPYARIPLKVASAIGGAFFPRVAAEIPGTDAHHNLLVRQAENAVQGDEMQANNASKRGLEEAQATEQRSLPELHQTQAELANERASNQREYQQGVLKNTATKNATGEEKIQNDATKNKAAQDTAQRKLGLVPDGQGGYRPATDEEMSPVEKSLSDYKKSQVEYNQARAANQQAQAEHQPDKMALTQRRLELATESLGMRQKEYLMHAFGTDEHNNPLPGATQTATGETVGTANMRNNTPTSGEVNKGDLARSAVDRVGEMREILKRRPDLFGPGNGRISNLQVAIGNQDPDAQTFLGASKYLADHSAALFGGRSQYVMQGLQGLTSPHINVNALNAAIDEAERTAKPFAEAGTRHTVGGPHEVKPGGGAAVEEYVRNPKTGKLEKKQ